MSLSPHFPHMAHPISHMYHRILVLVFTTSVQALRLATVLLEQTPLGSMLAPLLAELQRQLLARPLLPPSADSTDGDVEEGAPSTLEEACARARLLQALASLHPIGLTDSIFVRLLDACARAHTRLREDLHRLIARQLVKLESLPALNVSQAGEVARAVMRGLANAECSAATAIELPSVAQLATLSWIPKGHLRALADAFPLGMLATGAHGGQGGGQGGGEGGGEGGAEGGGEGGGEGTVDGGLQRGLQRDLQRSLEGTSHSALVGGPPAHAGEALSAPCDALCVLMVLHALVGQGALEAPRWLKQGAVGVALIALSAERPLVRRLGYETLGSFMRQVSRAQSCPIVPICHTAASPFVTPQLPHASTISFCMLTSSALEDGPSFRERPGVLRLLCSLRDAITQLDERLPCITTTFVAHGLYIMMQPHHAQYKPMNAFLLERPFLALDALPMFFATFHSGSPRQREERHWMLCVLRAGLRTEADESLCARRFVLQLILSFHDSHLADAGLRRACLGMLARAAELPEAAELLVHRHGVFAWIESLCNGPQPAEALSDQLGLLQRLLGSSGAGGWTAEALRQCGVALAAVWRALQAQHGRNYARSKPAEREGVVSADARAEAVEERRTSEEHGSLVGGTAAPATMARRLARAFHQLAKLSLAHTARVKAFGASHDAPTETTLSVQEVSALLECVYPHSASAVGDLEDVFAKIEADETADETAQETANQAANQMANQMAGESAVVQLDVAAGRGQDERETTALLVVDAIAELCPSTLCEAEATAAAQLVERVTALVYRVSTARPSPAARLAGLTQMDVSLSRSGVLGRWLRWLRRTLERSRSVRRALLQEHTASEALVCLYRWPLHVASCLPIERLAEQIWALEARMVVRALNRTMLLLLAERDCTSPAPPHPGLEAAAEMAASPDGAAAAKRQRSMVPGLLRSVVPELLTFADRAIETEGADGMFRQGEEMLIVLCRELWYGQAPNQLFGMLCAAAESDGAARQMARSLLPALESHLGLIAAE